ncbi:MAG: diadenylate cyclase CdaA [Chloroflexota bacterium]
MPPLAQAFLSTINRISFWGLIDILIVALLIYAVLSLFKGTTAFSVLYGIILLFVAVMVISSIPGLVMLNWLLRNSLPFLSVALIILFQPELRRAMERIGRLRPMLNYPLGASPAHGTARAIEDIALTCRRLAERRWGALIVLERRTGLQEYSDTGVRVDGAVTVEFLLTVFFPNSPLHDGAVIVHGDRVVAAGCLLPLSDDSNHYQELGTRHRAALGISEETDAIAIVVSEETGIISIANNGRLVRNLDENKVKKVLTLLYGPQRSENQFLNTWLRRRATPSDGKARKEEGGSTQEGAESGA